MHLSIQESSGFSPRSNLFILSDFSVFMYLLPGECWSLAWILWRDFPWRWTHHPLLSFVKVQVLMLVNLPVCSFVFWMNTFVIHACPMFSLFSLMDLFCLQSEDILFCCTDTNSSLGTISTSSICFNEEEVMLWILSSFSLFCSTAFEYLKTVDYVYKYI